MKKLKVTTRHRGGANVHIDGYILGCILINGKAKVVQVQRPGDRKFRRHLTPGGYERRAREAANRELKPQNPHPAFDKTIPIRNESPQRVLQF
ncbi:NUDIX hydrolase [Patescibacteria group bacterium]|nr:NUDIX hydrolase [Patescibacteria group bacterium]